MDVEDDTGSVTTLKVLITVNHAPTIPLTSPADGAEFVSPAIVTLAATASDNTADGVLRQVQFFVNGEPVGTATKAPFEPDWPVTNPREYELTAAVSDYHNQVVTTPPASITVSQGAGIALTEPTADIAFAPGGTARLAAAVTPGAAAITKVDFFKNNQLIGADTEAPYELDWTEPETGRYLSLIHI